MQGDILYVIGEAGDTTSLPFLSDIAESGAGEDLKEAALYAIETINENMNRWWLTSCGWPAPVKIMSKKTERDWE